MYADPAIGPLALRTITVTPLLPLTYAHTSASATWFGSRELNKPVRCPQSTTLVQIM